MNDDHGHLTPWASGDVGPRGWAWRELHGVLADPGVSLAAKGVLWLLLSRPPGAVLSRAELFAGNADPMGAIDSAITELARAGLAVAVPPRMRGQGRRSGGVKLPARTAPQPPEPGLDPHAAIGRQRAGGASAWAPVRPDAQPTHQSRRR